MIKTKRQSSILIKLIVCCFTIIIWVLYRLHFNTSDDISFDSELCFRDRYVSKYIYSITKFLSQHLHIRDLFLITGSNSLDVLLLSYMAIYIKYGKSWTGIINMVLFYSIRGVFQNYITLSYYHTYLYTEPAFFSFFVPVFRAADFFWSGHCGITLIVALQFRNWGYHKTFCVGLIISLWQGFVMTSLRAHYSIDIIFGWLISHYCFWWSAYLGDALDKKFNVFGRTIARKSYVELKSLQVIRIKDNSVSEDYPNKSDLTV
jgi:hypothetical protein